MKGNLIFFSFVGLIGVSVGQIIQVGQCDPNIPVATNFNLTEFIDGTWFEVARTANPQQEGQCSSLDFSVVSQTENTTQLNFVSSSVKNNFVVEVNGIATHTSGTPRFSATFAGSNSSVDFLILDTNPQIYAILYACENINTTLRSVHVWQLLRTRQYPNEMVPALINITLNNTLGINALDLQTVSHSDFNCYVLPVIGEGQPIILPGQCDETIPVVQNFSVAQFLGVWHEIASYFSGNATGQCNRAEYSLGNGVVNVVNSQVINQTLDTIDGYATVSSNDSSARLAVVLNIAPGVTIQQDLWVLATDYNNYALSYTCENLGNNTKRIYSWILSRTSVLNANASAQVNQVVNSIIELNDMYYTRSDQSDAACFYYPTPALNQPVIFRGQCDQTIPVVQNFSAAQYLGLWHDTESYPTNFQDGTCANAFYSLSANGVDVFNTQVINRTLDTINGLAVVASTDGSARLNVTFPIAGTNATISTNYWVLATDYISYAFVYSCTNLGDNRRQVTSWKLSRTKQLPAAAATAINTVMNTVDVLDQRYFQTMDQSPEGCFYFPEPQAGVPVVFPGQCDQNITTIPNFNFAQFQGTWHEIQAYPKEQQPGQCVTHQFTVGGTNSFNLESSSVYDQFLNLSNGTATQITGTTDGRLTISFVTNGTVLSFPYWILATDYTNYALAYSCVNIGNDFRGIWSWKLSRVRTLSAASNSLIDAAMSNIEVLDNRYFENIDHSDDACFYLPELAPGEPIILPGQCDPNITVVQNFNAARYLGRWRLIEGYPSDSQNGTCEEANYSFGANGTVVVVNTEVVDQTLVSITGEAVVASTDGSGRLRVTFPNVSAPFEYLILDTDYDNYALVYGCVNINTEQRRVWSWKLSRSNTLSQNATAAINRVVNSVQVLNQRFYQPVDRSNAACFYFPEPTGEAVIFRGQCENITVMQNFNAAQYMGLWHEIEAYPAPFQTGTCNNALYTIVNGTVDVFNTQVINRTLDTITGTAVLASTDGSAKLLVTFPVAGINATILAEYWVLATDYTSYSLVYSCRDISQYERQVTSWKLSRTKQLTANASTAINAVVNTVDVLDQRYYEQTDQSSEGCFYFPEPQLGVPVVFPGQCDDNITSAQNFSMLQFQGTWHEIQAYPKEQQPGQCVTHQFTVGGTNYFNLESSSVYDQFLSLSNASAAQITGATDGRLTITIVTNGTVLSFPYWILATDYTNYALAYSCVNIGNDFRGIWSWKLSRVRTLSAAINSLIDAAMSNIDVLDNRYFENIDHSDDACFYLPELAPGEPIILPGQCDPNITVVPNFNAARYLGRWRLIEGYPSDSQNGTCEEANYSFGANGTVVVVNTEVVNQTLVSITGEAVVASTDGSGRLSVTFPNVPAPFEYFILDTDYENYALVYGCVNINTEQRRVWSWKLSRSNTLSENATAAINRVVNSVQVLNQRYYQPVDRSNAACFYYPEPTGEAVIFRGQCENITVMQNFNAAQYMGLWHEIEAYPAPFQTGTCNNALYTILNGTVDVFNTQVINRTLDTISGTAVLASTDGSAKLLVTFPVAGTNQTTLAEYWVLATDYNSYSLVYSCRDISQYERQVTSWKLSRTKQLTANASTAINAVVNTVDVLDQRYYEQTDQSNEGCFYFPEPQPGVPVVFPGQCDNNITFVQNFSMQQFQGLWHEIEAYPKEEQPGQCINHEFSVDTNSTLNLISNNVFNSILRVSNSSVRFASNDNSGNLIISITTNGTTIEIPYGILSTDYSSYALAYICVNLNSDFRGVWSWKLSRTKQLTAAANTSINNAIANVEVLDNRYYEPIDQTDNACFYLPDLGPNEPVEFNGQCDPNIPVVQNFDATRYLGLWRLIETYHSDFQGGTCNEATYSLGAGGVVVYNTQVINQTLDTIFGTAVAAVNGSGKLIVTFPTAPAPIEYWILDTDYVSYSLIYSCVNVTSDRRRVWSWKMSRTNTLTQNATTAINQVVNSVNVLDNRYFQTVDRTDAGCFYFPEPSTGPVIFRGQCNQNISVVTNFDAARYMGLWHDIESYPTPFQSGTCNNAFYSLNGGVVNVFNTQVINQTLDTINGQAVLATVNSTLAKLYVTFPIAGTNATIQTDYWVLATDYDTYSLVYSCVNLDLERRQVTSWKLSRAKQLTANASTAINAVLNTVDVLDQRYYLTRDQTPAGCFFFPDPQPGVPVVFPGQCDTNITVMPNFALQLFQGIWHEIEAYPKEEETGQCINHQFTSDTVDRLGLISRSVLNMTLGVSNGSLTFATNATNGHLMITITNNGTTVNIPYSIISTDYNSFAVAYSCVNINSDSRRVWSWKLSRSKQLTAAANTAINNAIANIDVLDNRYYEPIDQTDNACFYLPDLGPNEPVEFNGQCDPNIPVVQNFDATRYLGLWRLIETYHSDFQGGTCNEATYSLGAGGVVVYNTQVINQTLDTIFGTAVAAVNGSGKLIVTFPTAPAPIEYWILDTDYVSYSLIYSCVNVTSDRRRVWSWKMSRTNILTQNATTAINQVVNSVNVLDARYFQTVNRTDAACFYFPEPSRDPVILRGQCDQSIPVVQNFSAANYMGTWYDIESYPTPFQNGTCATAQYTLTGGVVTVQNSEVVGQQLRTMNGTALLIGTDGSARLNVTFVVGGVPISTDHWVLATDYSSYALVYSCRNIDAERRQVHSWKLSRTQNLTAAANTAINSVINTIDILRNDYYIYREHNEVGCLFYPDNFGGDVILQGECLADNLVPAVTNFSISNFAGTWHEIARFPSDLQNGECASTQYTASGANSFSVNQNIVRNESIFTTVIPWAVATSGGRGVITANISGVPFNNLFILGTDYSEYALAYSCRNLGNNTKQIYSWKLSRSRAGFSASANTIINNLVSNNVDLFQGYYRYTDQSNEACFHYPDFPVLPGNITLPGPCDPTIRGVANFNATAYLGRWFEIARYPQPTQQGQCNRAEYSLGTGVVNVLNSQVINETRSTISGTAVVASANGTGVLNVTFVVGGEIRVANYYVLATDYTNYALVYNCHNLDNGDRRVGSWKLSRTTSLSAQAANVIDSVIQSTQGLRQDYYQNTSQSAEDCFYIPEVNPTSAPRFRGQCETPNRTNFTFDIQRYVGWWHQIESYPIDGNTNNCISSQYQVVGNETLVVDTSVANGVGTVLTGTVVATADGRLTRTLANGVTEVLWVLDTDYETYSLLYSCINENEEYQRVWSAKHSKTRQLTQAAQNAMAQFINASQVLHPQFYLPINQSDSACFHYPEQTGGRIILPGQCDMNISVVQNFDVAAYGGTWYQIEKYPQVYESGTCIGARYILDEETGVVSVLNWEVIDGVLETITGTAVAQYDDGTARLVVTLPIVGTNDTTTSPLYVLATDYETYALAYSCSNINSFQRSIGAWKLSRTRTMPASGTTAINAVIQRQEELHQPFFLQIEHNDDCEQPSSALIVKSSIIMLLVCAFIQMLL